MTLPWVAGSAAVGVLAGPPPRAGVLARYGVRPPAFAVEAATARHEVTHLGMPDFRPGTGRSSGAAGGP
jgi:hypothetical protein